MCCTIVIIPCRNNTLKTRNEIVCCATPNPLRTIAVRRVTQISVVWVVQPPVLPSAAMRVTNRHPTRVQAVVKVRCATASTCWENWWTQKKRMFGILRWLSKGTLHRCAILNAIFLCQRIYVAVKIKWCLEISKSSMSGIESKCMPNNKSNCN